METTKQASCVCVTLLFGLMKAMTDERALRHDQPLGLSNVAWIKYSDYQAEGIRRAQSAS